MTKKIIGIDINEVLRSRSLQFDRYYAEEFGEEGLPDQDNPYRFDLRNDYKFEDGKETINYLNEELPDDISPLDYQIDEKTGKSLIDDFAFKPETKMVTGDEKFKRFMYEDYLFEIHGSAPPLYKELGKDIEKFYVKYKDQFDIRIVSKENWFTVPPTLFFLSKLMPRFKHYHFVENNQEMWETVDILITTDPELLNKPENKTVIKLTRPYNEQSKGDGNFEVLQVLDLVDNVQFEQLIGYTPTWDVKLGGELKGNIVLATETIENHPRIIYGDDLSHKYNDNSLIDK